MGTEGDDDITVTARDNSTHAGTDGSRDFTTSVNGGPEILWIDFSNLYIDARAGDDDITLRTPAPNLAPWGVSVHVAGGQPSAPEDGDRLVVETPGTTGVSYTPTGSDTGILNLDTDNDSVNDTSVAIGAFTGVCGLGYTSSPGGIEELVYEGEPDPAADPVNATDTLTVTTTNAEIIPGDPGSGVVKPYDTAGYPLLPLSYRNVRDVTVTGTAAVVTGTDEDDVITVSAAGIVTVRNELGFDNTVDVSAFSSLVINPRGGDDQITVDPEVWNQGGIRVTVLGGDPGDSDVLLMDHSAWPNLARTYSVNYRPGVADDAGTVAEGGNAFLDFSGIEHLQMLGNGTSDVLQLNDDFGDNTWQIAPGPAILVAAARSAIDGRTPVDFEQFDHVRFANNAGVDRFEVSPKRLTGSISYEVVGVDTNVPSARFVDTLVILGSGESDGEDPANDPFIVTDTAVTLGQTIQYSQLGGLELHGLGGDDTLQVDSSAAPVRTPMVFDGGAGSDTLQVRDAPTPTTFHEVIYSVGPAVTEGRLVYEDANNAVLMKIDFINLEPVQDNVPAATLTVVGTGADNAIDYVQGPNSNNAASIFTGQVTGLVQVDAFETIEFARKGALVINAGGGDDVVHLNNGTVPALLAGITVLGGDPTASDTLIVNGKVAGVLTVNTGTRQITNAEPVTVTYGTDVEALTVVEGISTGLSMSGSTDYTVNPLAAADEGVILTDTVPITFLGYGSGNTITLDGTDDLTVNGTNADDAFTVIAATGGTDRGNVTISGRATIDPKNLTDLTLGGFAGDDTFTIAAGHAFAMIALQGGSPDASDVAVLTGDGTAVAVTLADPSVTPVVPSTVVGGGLGTVSLSGIEDVDLNAAGGDVAVNGTAADDDLAYQPTAANAGRFTKVDLNLTLDLTNVGTLSVNGQGGDNTLSVTGTTAGNIFNVSSTQVLIAGLQGIDAYSNLGGLVVRGLQGSDTFNVAPAANTEVFVDGGDPIGVVGDRIVVTTAAATTFAAGPEGDEGGFAVTGFQAVSYDHIEAVSVNLQNNIFEVDGTNGADQIKVLGTGAIRTRCR